MSSGWRYNPQTWSSTSWLRTVRGWKSLHSYCGWKKSCTTWDGRKPINNGINHLSTGAGFLPSTVWFDDFSLWFEHEASTFTCSCCLEGTIGLHTQRRYYAPELQVAVAIQKGLDASHGAKCKQTRALSTADHLHFFSVTTVVTVAISITNPSPMAPVGRVLSCGHCAVVASPS